MTKSILVVLALITLLVPTVAQAHVSIAPGKSRTAWPPTRRTRTPCGTRINRTPKSSTTGLARVVTGVLKDDTELFKQFMDNESFKLWMTDTAFELTYDVAGQPPAPYRRESP
jgi:hypothetical protein